MNSLKKTAFVIAAALTGTLIATPVANAVPTISVSVNGSSVSALAPTAPATVTVPADNSVDSADAVKFSITGIDTGTVVSAVATNALIVPALATVAAPVTAAAGSATFSVNTGTGTTADFYVFTKTTAIGTVSVTNGGNVTVYYVKGTAGPAYNLAFAPAVSANTASSVKTVAKVTDVFGNAVAGVTPVASTVNATAAAILATSAEGTTDVTVTYPVLAGKSAVSLTITATDVTGFPAAVKTSAAFVEVADLATLLAAEKAARAADKAAADAALAAAVAKADADVKAAIAASTKAVADAKLVSDKAVADLTASVAALTKSVAAIKKAYNAMAKKYKFAPIK